MVRDYLRGAKEGLGASWVSGQDCGWDWNARDGGCGYDQFDTKFGGFCNHNYLSSFMRLLFTHHCLIVSFNLDYADNLRLYSWIAIFNAISAISPLLTPFLSARDFSPPMIKDHLSGLWSIAELSSRVPSMDNSMVRKSSVGRSRFSEIGATFHTVINADSCPSWAGNPYHNYQCLSILAVVRTTSAVFLFAADV